MNSQVGIIGMGIMGTALSRNMASHGITLSLYNRHVRGSEENVAANAISTYDELSNAQGFDELVPFVESLQSPRIILIMISSGASTQEVIDALVPLLSKNICCAQ